MSIFQREINLIGEEAYQKLKNSAVAVFGGLSFWSCCSAAAAAATTPTAQICVATAASAPAAK